MGKARGPCVHRGGARRQQREDQSEGPIRRRHGAPDRRSPRVGFGASSVHFTYDNRVVDGQLSAFRRSTRGDTTEIEFELERVSRVQGTALRAGTSGLSADDLVEAGVRNLLLGEALPRSLGLLEVLADPGIDAQALTEALARPDREAKEISRLIIADGLIGSGHAAAVTRFELGPIEDGVRALELEWEANHAPMPTWIPSGGSSEGSGVSAAGRSTCG